jgi:hypothetical protein
MQEGAVQSIYDLSLVPSPYFLSLVTATEDMGAPDPRGTKDTHCLFSISLVNSRTRALFLLRTVSQELSN